MATRVAYTYMGLLVVGVVVAVHHEGRASGQHASRAHVIIRALVAAEAAQSLLIGSRQQPAARLYNTFCC